jgi:hypothetical protein
MATVHIWHDSARQGWLWDDAEDHGGYDRCIPCGPFHSQGEAWRDANDGMGTQARPLNIEFGYPPSHYEQESK